MRFAADPAGAKDLLQKAGAKIIHVSPEYATVAAAVAPADLDAVAAVPGVLGVTEVLQPLTSTWGAQTCEGATTSGGVAQIRAAAARRDFNVDGTGQKVGVISDSFGLVTSVSPADDIRTGDLPGPSDPCGFLTPTHVLQENPVAGNDEGRAMAKIIHDVAPGAALAFAQDTGGDAAMAANIVALKADGAGVIVDDVSYFDEPFFQDGPLSNAVTQVTTGPNPAVYLSSAGNNNYYEGANSINSFESPSFRPGACPGVLGGTCEDFDSGATTDTTDQVTFGGSSARIDLQWDEPWNGVNTNLDLYLLNSAGTAISYQSTTNNATSQTPFEIVAPAAGTYQLVIKRAAGAGTPRLKFIVTQGGSMTAAEYHGTGSNPATDDLVGPAIFGHNGAANAISVAAYNFANSSTPEGFTSHGPLTLYHGPVSGTTPAPAITPQTLAKPDLAASDCGADTFFGGGSFCGTSAAAPHAAGVVALARQAEPGATRAQILSALTSTHQPTGAFGHDIVGSGLIDAVAALQALGAPAHQGDQPSPFFTTTGAITLSDPTQSGRLVRQVGASSCSNSRAAGRTLQDTAARHYDAYAFVNRTDATQCVRVGVVPTGCPSGSPFSQVQTTGYLGSFNPAAPLQNFGGYAGASPPSDGNAFSLSVPPGQAFAADVNEVTATLGCPSYRLTLDSDHPFASTLPSVTGPSSAGALSAVTGSWDGTPAFAYEWQRCDGAGNGCATVPGAPGSVYHDSQADVGHRFRVRVTATEHGKSASTAGAAASALVTDVFAPNTAITSGPGSKITTGTVKFGFRASEAGSTFRCKLDKHAAARCSSPKTYKGLKAGKHTFSVTGTDSHGNADKTPAVRRFTVVGPQTKTKSGPPRTTHSRSAKLTFSSNQKRSTFRCKLDRGKTVKCSSPKRYRHLKPGKHTFRVFAVNRSGVADPTPAKRTWTIKR